MAFLDLKSSSTSFFINPFYIDLDFILFLVLSINISLNKVVISHKYRFYFVFHDFIVGVWFYVVLLLQRFVIRRLVCRRFRQAKNIPSIKKKIKLWLSVYYKTKVIGMLTTLILLNL